MITEPVTLEVRLCDAGGAALVRAAAAVGAQAGLDVDHLADLRVMIDCLIGGMRSTGARRMHVLLGAAPGRVDIRVGPLGYADADVLRSECDLPGLGSVLDRIARVRTDAAPDGQYLLLALGSRLAEAPRLR